MPEPFVSIVTPVYNDEPYLEECIKSVLAQSHQDFEYIICNNHSKDRSGEIAADYAAKVIEFSGANTSSAFDFLTHLLGTKLPSEILQLSAAQGCKNFAATAAQSRELWELTRKVASETADPIKKSFASVLQNAA